MVHCKEGKGRTMCILAGVSIKIKIAEGKIDSDNYLGELANVFNDLRYQRGDEVITSIAQKHLLIDATKTWLENISN